MFKKIMSYDYFCTVGGNYGDKNVFSRYVSLFTPKLSAL